MKVQILQASDRFNKSVLVTELENLNLMEISQNKQGEKIKHI